MPKKKLLLFIFLLGLFLPSLGLAVADIYTACPRTSPYYIKGKCWSNPAGTEGEKGRIAVCYEGLVPCGLGKPIWEDAAGKPVRIDKGNCTGGHIISKGIPCQFCHIFVMIDGIVSFFLIYIVPYVAVLMMVIAGLLFYFGGAKPDLLTTGKKFFYGVLIGLVLIYGSYIFVGAFLDVLGVTDISLKQWGEGGPFIIHCVIE